MNNKFSAGVNTQRDRFVEIVELLSRSQIRFEKSLFA